MTDSGSIESDVLRLRLSALRETIDHVLRPLIPAGGPVAHIDFPCHSNVGDSAIWLGEARWLVRNANTRGYVCDADTYDPCLLRTRVPEGPILLHGGGSFGDLWPKYQHFREAVVRDFPDRPVVQLPQTVHFESAAALRAATQVFNAHSNFTLLARDNRSYALARDAFRANVILCPDMALSLSLPSAVPHRPLEALFLKRTDREAPSGLGRAVVPENALITDWLDEPPTDRWASHAYTLVSVRYPNRFAPLAARVVDTIAARRLERGVKLLSQGQRVFTDRLHAHVLCLLLGIPHMAIDNSYGKLSSFIDTWTAGTCEVSW